MENHALAGSYNVGPELTDCIKTSQLCDLFCSSWGEGARWKTVSLEGPHEAGLLRLDTSRAKSALGWVPVWDVKRAINESVEWYKAYYARKNMTGITEKQILAYMHEVGE